MSYLVLARKWRPQSFAEVVGQRHVVTTLQNAIKYHRIPQALLFCGPRGVGKTTVARILAKALNCEKGPAIEPCNQCTICQEITQGHSLDVYELDAASNTGVDDIREIKENVRYVPSKGRYKVYIIDETHMLSKSAFNALLKTLEEPPSYVIFILATTEPDKIPPTIISRCQRFTFKRIPSQLLFERLQYIATKEGVNIEDEALWLLVRAASGSLRDALSLLDQVISFASSPIRQQDVQEILGLFDTSITIELLNHILSQDLKAAMTLLAQISEEGRDAKDLYYQLLAYFRHLLMIKIDPKGTLVDLSEPEINALKEMAEQHPLSRLEQFFDLLLKAEEHIRLSTEPRFVLESAIIKMAEFSKIIPIEDLIKKLSLLKNSSLTNDTPETNLPSPSPIKQTVNEAKQVNDNDPIKQQLIDYFKVESPIIAAALKTAHLSRSDGLLKIRLLPFHADLLQDERFFKLLKGYCQQIEGIKDISIEKIDKPLDNTSPKTPKSQNFNLLREILKIFGGEVISNLPEGNVGDMGK